MLYRELGRYKDFMGIPRANPVLIIYTPAVINLLYEKNLYPKAEVRICSVPSANH
jgi:hypothetical protein